MVLLCCILPRTSLLLTDWAKEESIKIIFTFVLLAFYLIYHLLFLGLSPHFIIIEKIVLKTLVLFFCWIQILALRGSVKACICLRGPGVSSLSCGENTAVCPLLVQSVSSGEKASFQKGSPDICCIVEYGVSGTMLISFINRKTEKKRQKHILNHRCNTPLFTCVQSKAFKTPFCIFVPWFLIHTERAQRLYTLSTHFAVCQC